MKGVPLSITALPVRDLYPSRVLAMSAELTHELNNLLTIIRSSATLLGQGLPTDDPGQEYVKAITDAVNQAAFLTAQLPSGAVSGAKDAPHQPFPTDSGGGATNGAETVLLVEDEQDVRQASVQALSHLGYRLHSAHHPEEALTVVEKLAQRDETIDLLITDITLPGMSGYTLAQELQTRQPSLAVLYFSGHSRESLADELVNGHFLPKPFTLENLAKSVRRALDKSPE